MRGLAESLAHRATPELCRSLVDVCRRYEHIFYENDVRVFGPGGDDEAHVCQAVFCPFAPHLARSGQVGDDARARPLRKCAGACGYYYHRECVSTTTGKWEDGEETCLCGCLDGGAVDEGDAGSSDSEGEDGVVREESSASQARALAQHREHVQMLLSVRMDLSKAKTGGAKKNLASSAR